MSIHPYVVGQWVRGEKFYGRTVLIEEATVFDLSSLTQALATSVATMLLVRDGKLFLDDRLCRFFPNFAVHGKSQVTIRHQYWNLLPVVIDCYGS